MVRSSKERIAHFDPSLPADLIELLWKRPEAVVERGEPLQTKDVRRTVRLRWGSGRFVLKQYVEPTWRHALKHSFEPSRAWRTWSATHRLADAGIATPRAVACVQSPWGRLRRDSFMMYPYVNGRTLRSVFEEGIDEGQAARYWQQLCDLWGQLTELRISLSDTNIRNFIVCPAERLWVIDLDKTRRHWSRNAVAHYHRESWERLVRSVRLAARQAA